MRSKDSEERICFLVSHTHWDREWYRTFEAYRARWVDVVDALLETFASDPEFKFVLDGQAALLEDYLAVRPANQRRLAQAVEEGRLSVGPWYTQPDSFLPSGEAHVRNLLLGREVARSLAGRVSRVAYVPDSYGHPSQFPQLFRGFGLDGFLYWRGDDDASAKLPSVWRWLGPDGSAVTAVRLPGGYVSANNPRRNVAEAAGECVRYLPRAPGTAARKLLLHGGDHQPADPTAGALAEAIARESGWTVRRALLDDFVDALDDGELPTHQGELRGAVGANLLYGTYSTWAPVKLLHLAVETKLFHWLEPYAALGDALGLPNERPTIGMVIRNLLHNQAHDSLVGASADAVMKEVETRHTVALQQCEETTRRILERLAGMPINRAVPFRADQEVAVFNPSPHPRTDIVRFPIDAFPLYGQRAEGVDPHPLMAASMLLGGFTIEGSPARIRPSDDVNRVGLVASHRPMDLEFVAENIPPFGYRRFRLEPAPPQLDVVDDGRTISNDHFSLNANDDGTFDLTIGERAWHGWGGVLDEGDAGDGYDFAPVANDTPPELTAVRFERRRHTSGIQTLTTIRTFAIPEGLADARTHRSDRRVDVTLQLEARIAPGVERVDFAVRLDNTARDHRLRLRFPMGSEVSTFEAATTFDVVTRTTERPDDEGWHQPAPESFPNVASFAVHGLRFVAPGLYESVVSPDGDVLLTLVRAVGWLSRDDHPLRPENAGPGQRLIAAQCLRTIEAMISILPDGSLRAARDAEVPLCAVFAGPHPRLPPETPVFALAPEELELSAWKPAEDDDGIIVRILNPTNEPQTAILRTCLSIESAHATELDETPATHPVERVDGTIRFLTPAHALRTIRIRMPRRTAH